MNATTNKPPKPTGRWQDYFQDNKDAYIEKLLDKNTELSKQLRMTRKQLKAAIDEIEHHRRRAETDHLTGVGSRHSIDTWGDQYYAPDTSTYLAVVFDLVNFKYLNDTYGHTAGDQALAKFASKLMRSFRFIPRTMGDGMFYSRDGLYIRQGGDEFAVVLMVPEHLNAEHFMRLIAKRIENALYVHYDELDLIDRARGKEPPDKRIECRYGMCLSEPGMSLKVLLAKADDKIVK